MARHSASPRSVTDVVAGVSLHATVSNGNVIISGITQDSRDVQPGDIYCCIRGEHFNGHSFIGDALTRGAVALIVDEDVTGVLSEVAVIRVDDVRDYVGYFASSLFGYPSRDLEMVGVTGTNGKTTTTAMIASILATDGRVVRQIGTLSGARTTPEAIDLHAQLASWRDEGVQAVVMEVSSHALVLHRVNGMKFSVSVFTNIGRDHLDFHKTEEAYFAAKARLFSDQLSQRGVVNVDDPKGALLCDAMTIPMDAFSTADATNVEVSSDSVSYTWNGQKIHVPMGGSFTLANSLAAATASRALGVSTAVIALGLKSMQQVPGRFESIPNSLNFAVIVDYAHTPESVESLLTSVRGMCEGRVIVVFGCGGNRDEGKRSLMGRAAGLLADVVIVTSDNPRNEDPNVIIEQVCSGLSTSSVDCRRIEDRSSAIESAINEARRGDIVVIAGKGHEATQEVSGVLHPFSDAEVAQKFLRQREESTQ